MYSSVGKRDYNNNVLFQGWQTFISEWVTNDISIRKKCKVGYRVNDEIAKLTAENCITLNCRKC